MHYGAKYRDEDGRSVKYVEFAHDDPKSSCILGNCINVPWKLKDVNKAYLYGNDIHISHFADDVDSDPRLIKLGAPFDSYQSITQDARVQSHADKEYSLMVRSSCPGGYIGMWIMDFVEHDEFARYCLVPLNVRPVEERLERAIEHLNTYMSDDALGRYAADQSMITKWRMSKVREWTSALVLLNGM